MSHQTLHQVSLTGQLDRTLIPLNQPSERYLLIKLRVPTPTRPINRSPLNLSLIIDRSGSMSGDKLEYVKEAAIHALRSLTEADRTSIIIYDDQVETLSPSRAVTSEVREDLIRRIRQIRTGGMTNLSGGWFTGCDQIADYMTSAYLNRALLLTDGLANVGMTDQEQLVYQSKELRRRGISTTTFGVGRDFNQFLLQGIADAGGGHFYFIDKPNQIANYFEGELGELLQTVVREMTLDIEAPQELDITWLNDASSERQGGRHRLFLGNAYAGEERTLIARIKVPPQSNLREFQVSLTLRYEDAEQHQPVTIEGEVIGLTVAEVGVCEQQSVNEGVLKEAGRMETEQAKMEALRREYAGDVAGAQSVLRQVKANLSVAMPAPMAASLGAELDEMEAATQSGMTHEERKERHYVTYQVQRSRKDYKK